MRRSRQGRQGNGPTAMAGAVYSMSQRVRAATQSAVAVVVNRCVMRGRSRLCRRLS